jgi:hypothetical protein
MTQHAHRREDRRRTDENRLFFPLFQGVTRHRYNGRGDRIRTCDPLVPNQMRYQAAPLPDKVAISSHGLTIDRQNRPNESANQLVTMPLASASSGCNEPCKETNLAGQIIKGDVLIRPMNHACVPGAEVIRRKSVHIVRNA